MSFKPVVRFAVVSDVHYADSLPHSYEQFKLAMERTYQYCDGQEYNKLDALYVNGDFVHKSLRSQFESFYEDCRKYVKPETLLVCTLANHELHYDGDWLKSRDTFKEIFNMPTDRHEVINGYHFISLSGGLVKGPWHDSYSDDQKEYLKAELDKAVSDCGNRPIFVFQHVPMFGTLPSIGGNGDLTHILSHYPQVIDFSGHSHYACNNPREIHQQTFTSVGSGALISAGVSTIMNGVAASENLDKKHASHMLIVEADANSTVRIRRFSVCENKFFDDDSYIEPITDIRDFKYTDRRGLTAATPYFPEGAKIEFKRNDGKITMSFPRAKCDTERVYEYRVCLFDKNGTVLSQKSALSDYNVVDQSDSYTWEIDDIPKAEYAKFYAIGFWDNICEPVTVDIV